MFHAATRDKRHRKGKRIILDDPPHGLELSFELLPRSNHGVFTITVEELVHTRFGMAANRGSNRSDNVAKTLSGGSERQKEAQPPCHNPRINRF